MSWFNLKNYGSIDTSKKLKLVLLGDGECGKTSFFNRIFGMNNNDYKFNKRYIATKDFNIQIVEFKTNFGNIIIELWDTAGQENDLKHNLRQAYIKGADAAFIMYDISNRRTKENVFKWLSDLNDVCSNIPVLLLGNKMDLLHKIGPVDSVKFRKVQLYKIYKSKNINSLLLSIKANKIYELDDKDMLYSFQMIFQMIYGKNIIITNVLTKYSK